MDLIQSIKNFLQNDETKFNEFKNYSGQFRQVTFKPRFQLLFFFFPSVILIYNTFGLLVLQCLKRF